LLKKLDYPAFFDLLNLPLPENRAGILEKLAEENVIVSTIDGYSITNLGAILFAKDLRDFTALERKIVRVVVFRDDTKLHPVKEMPGAKGYAVGFESLID